MNKADLKQKWSKYCDTDQLVNDMMTMFKRYGHSCTEHGVCVALNTYFTNKAPLIDLISDSKNYLGNMRIAVQKEFDRQIGGNEVYAFINTFERTFHPNILLKSTDEDNKTFEHYFKTGKNSFSIDSLPSEEDYADRLGKMRKFDYNRNYLLKSWQDYNAYAEYLRNFRYNQRPTLVNDMHCGNGPELKKGTKTSRAFNHVCTHYGIDKMYPEDITVVRDGQTTTRTVYPYDKMFAQFADLVSDLKRKLYFVISLNPLDYFTMSVGINWKSCHHIETGSWKGGCMSYMLDKTSMITYVISTLEGDIHEAPKYYRQMYHYKNNLFVQNRLYPQGNDGATDLYEKFRGFVIEEFSPLLDVDEHCCAHQGTGGFVYSEGVHYRDYECFDGCCITYPKEWPWASVGAIVIGHKRICPNCGHEISDDFNTGMLTHDRC